MNIKYWARLCGFLIITYVIYARISLIFCFQTDERNYQWIAGFSEEKADSLDAVFIGSSATYAFWTAPVAFENYGITVRPFCCNSQPFAASKYLIADARKKHPDALYIVPINTLNANYDNPSTLHYLLDYLPFSINKLKLTWKLADLGDYSYEDRLEFYVPLIRYHSDWQNLTADNFNFSFEPYKGGATYSTFLYERNDINKKYERSEEIKPLNDTNYEIITDLLDYCEKENVRVLFVTMPRAGAKDEIEEYNAAEEFIASRGFPVLDMMHEPEAFGLDLSVDYYNGKHTNIHGSIKVTNYISEYLVDNYGFTDKSNSEGYDDWTKAMDSYHELINPYLTPEDDLRYNPHFE